MIATDGIYFTSPHPTLPLSDVLGDWGMKEKPNLTIFKPGVYWDDESRKAIRLGEAPIFKARGINVKAFAAHVPKIDRMFESTPLGGWPQVKYQTDFSMTTVKMAMQRGKWQTAGEISDPTIDQSSDPSDKRCGVHRDGNGVIRTLPLAVAEQVESKPYTPQCYREEVLGALGVDEEYEDPNDKFGVSPDGPIYSIFAGQVGTGQWAA